MDIVLILFMAGIIVGFAIRKLSALIRWNDHLTNISIYLLLFLLGVNVGSNEEIIHNFEIIGFHSFLVSIFAVSGSILCAWMIQKIVLKKEHEI